MNLLPFTVSMVVVRTGSFTITSHLLGSVIFLIPLSGHPYLIPNQPLLYQSSSILEHQDLTLVTYLCLHLMEEISS